MKHISILFLTLPLTSLGYAADSSGVTPEEVFATVKSMDLDAVKDLIYKQHANCNVRDESGNTPLMFAALQGDHDMVKFLLGVGADPKARSNDGTMPLMTAAMSSDRETLDLLLSPTGDANVADGNGFTPLMLAS